MKNTLEIEGVILEYNQKSILQDVYLKCETGHITGLLGRNGSGKTSLMNIIYGNINAKNSSVRINSNVLHQNYRNPEFLRYLPQFNFIPKNFKIKRIFSHFRLDFDEFITFFNGFKKYEHSTIGKLSSGEKRIIEIYCILCSKSQFCLLDEPFSQIMPLHIETIKQLIIREKKNKGILITDHLYQHIIDICDEIYIIKDQKAYLTKSNSDIESLGYISA